jgi:integrase
VASIGDRWHVTKAGRRVRSDRYGKGLRWVVRYRDPSGASRNRSFERRVDADRYLTTVRADILRGQYVDPNAGRMTFREYADRWLEQQTFESSTRVAVEVRLKKHIYPSWGDCALSGIKPSGLQSWLRELQRSLAPSHVRVIFTNMSTILSAAVDDERISKNPCRASSVRVPAVPPRRVSPWTSDRVGAVVAELPPRYRAAVVLAATCGLRQGEAFGVRVHDVDFLRRELHVRQQIRLVGHEAPAAALPKYRRTRAVPLPEWAALTLAEHIAKWPPLGGDHVDGPALGGLISYGRERNPLNRNYFNAHIWKPALRAAGVPVTRDNGMHALRHYCASAWLEHGVNIKAVSEYLGHADPGFTLRTYTHVMPTSDARAREAIDVIFGEGGTSGAHLAHKMSPSVSQG